MVDSNKSSSFDFSLIFFSVPLPFTVDVKTLLRRLLVRPKLSDVLLDSLELLLLSELSSVPESSELSLPLSLASDDSAEFSSE